MRARSPPPPSLLLPLLLSLLLSPLLPAAAPAPLLLLARPACRARDGTLLSQSLLQMYAAAERPTSPSRPYRLLGFEETCGPQWEMKVARSAIATLASGGSVVSTGKLSAALCGMLTSTARVFHRPRIPICAESSARAAALTLLAARLHWRRVYLPMTLDASECTAALLDAERALVAAGVSVQRTMTDFNITTIGSNVVVYCYTPTVATVLKNLHKKTSGQVMLLRVESNDEAVDTGSKQNGTTRKGTASGIEHSAPPGSKGTDDSMEDINRDSVNIKRGGFFKHRRRRDLFNLNSKVAFDRLNVSEKRRVLMLSDKTSEKPSSAIEVYDGILKSMQQYEEEERNGNQMYQSTFFFYESFIEKNTPIKWNRMATLRTSSKRSINESKDWTTQVEIENFIEFERWSALRTSEQTEHIKSNDNLTSNVAIGALCLLCVICGMVLAVTLEAARRLSARRAPRRPRAAPVLAAAEFQFPADDRRRVGEGMETMLSWLQQFHDFGGPEVERPDLLKRPEALVPSAPSSTCSVTRLAPDNRPRYKGDAVHMKYLPAATLELRRKATDVLLVMQSLRHENLNPFIGCLAEARPALVFEACGRGSLEDVLVADDIRLDWTFRLSLLTDLVRGMRYLHASPLRAHARLTSRNCVVDSRWVLRVTDYGLPAFVRAQALPYPPRSARELLWTAPELLREVEAGAAVPAGTQAGDVFSFAIIMQEVIVRGEPYCMLSLTPEEIIDKLSHPPPLIRPSVSIGAAPPEAVSVMRQCWSEQPDLRPDFARLYEIFRHMHRGRKVNIVDSMFEMLEKYSNNLEELIKERTEQLDMEKKKTEQLLNRMLPRTVAESLLLGLRVEPEEFEEVSIYFSDIVGFTAIAARSTPVQVVDLLNDLYTTFDAAIEQYRVYKVETIGDAYMVVGGLPERRDDHAESVATMALHLLSLAGRLRARHLPARPLHLRIGLHTGACCAGVVGLTMPRYCLFGDTVNTASRMESTGAAWRIQVSEATADKLAAAGGYRLRPRGLTQIKGKGAMYTYWLLGKDGFDKPLPTPPPLESEEVLFETEGENESDASETSGRGAHAACMARQRSDPTAAAGDKLAWQRSGAVSADSSPPAPPAPRCRYLRSSVSTVACLLDPPRPADRWASGSTRVLRRQWSLERGDVLAAAAAELPRAPPPAEPLALRAATPRAPTPRYRTRRDTSAQRDPSALRDPSAQREPSVHRDPSTHREPSIHREPATNREPSTHRESSTHREPSTYREPPSRASDPSLNRETGAHRELSTHLDILSHPESGS